MSSVLTRRSIFTLAGGALVAAPVSGASESDCSAYLDAWSHKDIEGIAAHLHPQVHFKGPMQELNGREQAAR
jgi:hypothetical protein